MGRGRGKNRGKYGERVKTRSDNLINQSVSDRLRSGPIVFIGSLPLSCPRCLLSVYSLLPLCIPESINRRFSFRLLNTRHPPDPPRRICQESKNLYRRRGGGSLSLLPRENHRRGMKKKKKKIAAQTPIFFSNWLRFFLLPERRSGRIIIYP